MARILVTDPLAPEGAKMLKDAGHEIVERIGKTSEELAPEIALAEGWVIRSETKVGATELAKATKLRAIARAGVGVDNVDLNAATDKGVAVFNSPTGNITSAAEQAWALLLGCARRTSEADAGMKAEKWLRKSLGGFELAGKTILIIGLGRIGRMMAARAQAFEMITLGFDPFVTGEQAASFGVELVDLTTGPARADIITLHTPLTTQTKHLIDAEFIGRCKPGVVIINAARGGLIDSTALLAGLESKRVSWAGLDVFEEEPPTDWKLAKHPRVVAAPHLGASTQEAQTKAAMQACDRLIDYLKNGDAAQAVNVQISVPKELRPWAKITDELGQFVSQMGQGSIQSITVECRKELQPKLLLPHATIGALRTCIDESVNAINGLQKAQQLGWALAHREVESETVLVRVQFEHSSVTSQARWSPELGGRIVKIQGMPVNVEPVGKFLVTRHRDVPGALATITRILADSNVNVANLSLARAQKGDDAIAIICVDGSIPKEARDHLRRESVIHEAHRIRMEQA